MICQQCGTENAPGDKFCEHCGAPLAGGPAMDDGGAATMVGAPPSAATLVRSDDPGQTYQLGNRVVVGRLDSCDIAIHDKSVSREHARLSQLPGGYVVEDLGSTNGTLVNGERITEPVILRPGDSVTFGSIDFHFEEAGGFAVQGADSGSTQPFQYRPPEQAAEPAEQPFPSAEPPPFPTPEPQPATPEPSSVPGPVTHPFASSPAPFAPADPEPQGAAAEEAPAFEFPPLQPFSAPEPEPAAPPAELEPEPVAPVEPEPEPVAPVESKPVPIVSPVAAEPAVAEIQPSATAAAEPAPVSPVPASPVPIAPSASPTSTSLAAGDGLPDDAVAAAAHLNDLVQALAQRAAESEARAKEMEGHSASREAVVAALSSVPPLSVDDAQLTSIQEMLDQLIQNPRDIEVLMQVGRQAGDLATVVREYSHLRDAMDRVSQAAG